MSLGATTSGPPCSTAPPSLIQLARPYLTTSQIELLGQATHNSYGVHESQSWNHAFSLIFSTGNQLRFPIRTMGTAAILFQRFYLFNSLQKFPVILDTALACLFVASKMEDTLKKLRDILLAAHRVRHPNGPEIGLDSSAIEEQRRRIIPLERQVLETMSFDFRVSHPQKYIIKFCRKMNLSQQVAETAWLLMIDSYKTLAPLKYPPHAIALACLSISVSLLNDPSADHISANSEDFKIPLSNLDSVILELLAFYIDWLPLTALYSRFPDTARFMDLRISVNQRVSSRSTESPISPANHQTVDIPSNSSTPSIPLATKQSKRRQTRYNNSNNYNGRGGKATPNSLTSPSIADSSPETIESTSTTPISTALNPSPGLIVRDPTLGDRGTIRFVLDWNRERIERSVS
ncbi:cyclin-like protein [Lipomyces oligophaga]|uniref:cyclin-like protein n=1 Tax=Lipomyces oligophaga TaxID=45792 RepID=UPI0034CE4818